MKKNVFFALLEEELEWLKRAASPEFSDSPSQCEEVCRNRHKALVLRLFRDFMPPLERRNLYGISLGILELFSCLRQCGPLSSEEADPVLRAVDLLLPLPFDERILSLQEAFDRTWSTSTLPRKLYSLRKGFSELFRLVTVAALDHA